MLIGQREKRIALVVIGTFGVALLILLVVVSSGGKSDRKGERCALTSVTPLHNAIKTVPSADKWALVRLAAYLEVWPLNNPNNSTYLRMELEKVLTESKDNKYIITMDTYCVILTLTFKVVGERLQLENMNALITQLEGGLNFYFDAPDKNPMASDHYKCDKWLTYSSQPNRSGKISRGAKIHFNNVEYELEGDRDNHAKGLFDTPAKEACP